MSTGTVMSVGDKDQLLVLVLDAKIREIHSARERSALKDGGASAAQLVMGLVRPFIELFAADEGLFRAYAAVLVAGSHESVVFTQLAERLQCEIAESLAELGQPQPDTLARACYFAYLGWLLASPVGGGTAPERLSELSQVLVGILREDQQ